MIVKYGSWLQCELWSLGDAVLLLYGINPNSNRASLLKESFKTDTAPRGKRGREVCKTYHGALSAIRAGVLPCEDGEVRVLEFLRWARRHHLPLPEDLAAFLISKDKPRAEKPLSTRERRTFLVIIAAALEEAGIDITHPEADLSAFPLRLALFDRMCKG